MHRHTTNSISTASAVLLALRKKAYFKKRSPGTKWGLQYQLPLMGRGVAGGHHISKIRLLSLSFQLNMFFILWGDKAEWWGGILHDWADAVQEWQMTHSWVRKTFIFFFWFPFFPPIDKVSHHRGAQLQFAPALHVVLFSVAVCGWNIGLLRIHHLRTI